MQNLLISIKGIKPMIDQEQIDMWGYWGPEEATMTKVQEFARVMGQKVNPKLSAQLIEEEFLEWMDEYHEGEDSVKELKELSDLVYVVYGYANSRGWDLDTAVVRVHNNNMARCIWPDGSIKRRADGKILKNPDAPKVKLDDLV